MHYSARAGLIVALDRFLRLAQQRARVLGVDVIKKIGVRKGIFGD